MYLNSLKEITEELTLFIVLPEYFYFKKFL